MKINRLVMMVLVGSLFCLLPKPTLACFQLPYSYNGHVYSDAIEDTFINSYDGHTIKVTYYYNPNPDMQFHFTGEYGGVLVIHTASSYLRYWEDLTANTLHIQEHWSDDNNGGYGFQFGINNDYLQPSPMDTSDLYTTQDIVMDSFSFPANWDSTSCNDGLVAHYQFEDNANDSTENNNHGTTFNAFFVDGISGRALQFTGEDNSYVEIPHSPSLSTPNAVTVSFWAKVYGYPTGYSSAIYKAGDEPTANGFNDRSYSFWLTSTGGVHFTSTPDGASSQIVCDASSNMYSTGEFVHFAGVVDTSTDRLGIYVNGQPAHECFYSGESILAGDKPLRIGGPFKTLGDQSGVNGVLDEVRIYNRALSDSEILQLSSNEPSKHRLIVTTDGTGEIMVIPDPIGADCGPNCWEYPQDEIVLLQAFPNEGTRFVHWDSGLTTNSQNPMEIIIDNDQEITAVHRIEPLIERDVRALNFTSLCSEIGDEIWGEYIISKDDIEEGDKCSDKDNRHPYPSGDVLCREYAQIGGDTCLGRCGLECKGPQKVYIYTKECFNHDLCTRATDNKAGPCLDELLSARVGYVAGLRCFWK
jgi:hypothetical protein